MRFLGCFFASGAERISAFCADFCRFIGIVFCGFISLGGPDVVALTGTMSRTGMETPAAEAWIEIGPLSFLGCDSGSCGFAGVGVGVGDIGWAIIFSRPKLADTSRTEAMPTEQINI